MVLAACTGASAQGRGDVTRDGVVDAQDVSALVGYILDPESLPGNGGDDELPPAKTDKVVCAYFYHWSSQLPNPQLVTHIVYCFAEVYCDADGNYKSFKLQSGGSSLASVVALKQQNPNLKILLGFTNSRENEDHIAGEGGFSKLVSTQANRAAFAHDCLQFLDSHNLDGVDLDWEFPGMTFGDNVYDVKNDTPNFTLLLEQLRDTLGSERLITFAGYIKNKERISGGMRYINLPDAVPYVDFINVMAYDMDSADEDEGYQSALFHSGSYWDCVRIATAYAKVGVPFSKMVLGIPFYVRHSFAAGGIINYCDLANLDDSYVTGNWNASAMVPYVTKDGAYYGSYDDPQSIAMKGAWMHHLGRNGGMRGMMYWEAGNDDAQYTLSRAVWRAVMRDY